ncbi:MAG: tRNA adenosine(34) deaminase TadA [Endomicrobium sp.]|nr:tRNA adenosine(34) deaminase TadA [Endomicrobium sp.]
MKKQNKKHSAKRTNTAKSPRSRKLAKQTERASCENFMMSALKEAKKAQNLGEAPIGAVIVKDNKIVAKGFNRCIADNDPTAHAEIIVLRKAAKKLNNYRLNGCDIYVTIEPCAMCAGALVNARITRLFYGAENIKAGGCKSVFQISNNKKLNHRVETKSGVLKDECRAIIKNFFKDKR